MIENYSFGQMLIDGKKYNSDLIIFKDYINSNWWRREGHSLHIDDINEIINKKPEVLIIGTGYYGLMKVTEELIKYINSSGIEKVIVKKSKDACDEYNKLYKKKKVIAAFHLTC